MWQLAEYATTKKILALILAGIGVAGAMLAKGPIGAMVPALALGTDLLLKRDWQTLFRWQWLWLIPIVLFCLSPMLYGLYEQYDASGGRQTYNGFITSGIRFYFWTQSFGRLTGESTWSNDTGPFYFIHTFLWPFLPWSLLFLIALGKKLEKIIFNGLIIKRRNEALTIGGTVFPFIAFSMSHYKLPHYIFVLFPLCAILTGAFVRKLIKKYDGDVRPIIVIQYVVSVPLIALGVYVLTLFPVKNIMIVVIALLGAFMTAYYMIYRGTRFKQLLFPSFFAIITLNFIFNTHFYPNLLRYESGNVAAQLAVKKRLPLYGLNHNSYGMDFYYGQGIPRYTNTEQVSERTHDRSILVYTDAQGATQLRNSPTAILNDTVLQHFHVSSLNGRFLDPKTRESAVEEMHLLNVKF